MGKPTIWFPNRSDTNRSVKAQKRAKSLKFRIKVEEELYYASSENKGADQLRSYCEADLRLCFRLSRLLVFPCGGSFAMTFSVLSRCPIKWRQRQSMIKVWTEATKSNKQFCIKLIEHDMTSTKRLKHAVCCSGDVACQSHGLNLFPLVHNMSFVQFNVCLIVIKKIDNRVEWRK